MNTRIDGRGRSPHERPCPSALVHGSRPGHTRDIRARYARNVYRSGNGSVTLASWPRATYAARSRRDPEWREAAIAGAVQRERARREADPEGHRARRREATARCRAKQTAAGYTLHELWTRIGPRSGAGRQHLALVLRQEVERGTIDYLASSRRYRLNGGLPDDVKLALRDVEL